MKTLTVLLKVTVIFSIVLLSSGYVDAKELSKTRIYEYVALVSTEDEQNCNNKGNLDSCFRAFEKWLSSINIDLDFEKALMVFTEAAEQGNSRAQYALAELYSGGSPISKDLKKSSYWYEVAARNGNPDAQLKLGLLFLKGKKSRGFSKDIKQFKFWVNEAISSYKNKKDIQKNSEFQFNLAFAYQTLGRVFPENNEKALFWYKKAAKRDLAKAIFYSGLMYEAGKGVPVDMEKAPSLYLDAANQGDPEAQNIIGFLYQKGDDFPKDYQKALYWYKKSASQGFIFPEGQIRFLRETLLKE